MSCPWLRHYPAHVPPQLTVPRGNLAQLLEQAAAAHPERPYLWFLNRPFTYADVRTRAQALAAALQALNLPRGSRVALALPNSPAYVTTFWGTLLAGHTVVNLNPLLTEPELHHMLTDSGAKVLITFTLDPAFTKLQRAAHTTAVAHRWAADLAADMPVLTGTLFKLLKARTRHRRLPAGWLPLAAMLAQFRTPAPVKVASSSAAILQYTGGTTGTPKAAVLTHASLLANATQVKAWLGPTRPEGETMIAVLPLFHVFALTAILTLGTAIAAQLVLMPQFKLPDLLRLIRRHRPTLLPGVPTLFNALASNPLAAKLDLTCLRFCISGGAPLPAAVHHAFTQRTGAALVEGYGLTEASPVVACGPAVGQAPAGSVGYPLPGTEVRIRAAKPPFRTLPQGEIGEIWVKGPQVMAGYWHNPAATRATLRQGWLKTGDLGYLDAHGALHLVDRLKDLINVNGYKVYPRQVEEVLATHPAIAEVLVLGVPHPVTGEAPKAFVTLKPEHAATPAELLRWAQPRLSKMARLAGLEIRTSLPKTLVGKLSRKDLAAELAAAAPSTVKRQDATPAAP